MHKQNLTVKALPIHVMYYSTVGPVRSQNQDNLFVASCANPLSRPNVSGRVRLETGSVQAVAVFDGMGGETNGEQASLLAADLLGSFTEKITNLNDRQALRQAADSYYREFLEALDEYLVDSCTVCGTTCAGVVLQGSVMAPFWLGDSRVYLLRRGVLSLLTKDHTVAQNHIDGGFITEEAARKTPAWHTLTAFMGQYYEETLFLADPLVLQPGDRILICSDGVTDAVEDLQLREILKKSPTRSLQELEQISNTLAKDNCTSILICVGNDLTGRISKNLERIQAWVQSKSMDSR